MTKGRPPSSKKEGTGKAKKSGGRPAGPPSDRISAYITDENIAVLREEALKANIKLSSYINILIDRVRVENEKLDKIKGNGHLLKGRKGKILIEAELLELIIQSNIFGLQCVIGQYASLDAMLRLRLPDPEEHIKTIEELYAPLTNGLFGTARAVMVLHGGHTKEEADTIINSEIRNNPMNSMQMYLTIVSYMIDNGLKVFLWALPLGSVKYLGNIFRNRLFGDRKAKISFDECVNYYLYPRPFHKVLYRKHEDLKYQKDDQTGE